MFRLRDQVSALVPEYIVTEDPSFFPGDGAPLPMISFTGWLPPARRVIRIHRQTPPIGEAAAP